MSNDNTNLYPTVYGGDHYEWIHARLLIDDCSPLDRDVVARGSIRYFLTTVNRRGGALKTNPKSVLTSQIIIVVCAPSHHLTHLPSVPSRQSSVA